jgi:hypothetical protein
LISVFRDRKTKKVDVQNIPLKTRKSAMRVAVRRKKAKMILMKKRQIFMKKVTKNK